ncbi:tail fiber domain-containing protein [Dyadobacter sp. CY343]|uniref:tail fiber domain-containing protein n=1 Tax=Dyadobacter sp. CY343 TaxID=2907299 RepID=UPI001F2FD0AC|nr:tail fiber domain-containing protein [Dyadobacter sp. CY343]
MKMYQILLAFLFLTQFSFAQAPEKFSFQGVARNAEGKLVASRDVSIRISIRPETALGSPVYQETHTAKTTANGIFTIQVGGGAGLSGQMNNIDWKSGKYFLQVEMDIDGAGNYTDFGITQLLSVPYAIHATESVEAASAQHANTADEAGRWKNDDPIVQEGMLQEGAEVSNLEWIPNRVRLMWYPKKAAFRFGRLHGSTVWSDNTIGDFSFAGGVNAIASKSHSFAYGSEATATGNDAIALGQSAEATGKTSIAFGFLAKAIGDLSIAIGTEVKSFGSNSAALGFNVQSNSRFGVVLGAANDISDAVEDEIKPTQRLFQIGNGDVKSYAARSNALTILRNGNVGIGNNALAPTHILDVGSRIRLRSNEGANTAGLFLDNLNNVPYCFIGGVNDSEAGFYFEEGAAWRFKVNKNGSAWLAGTLTQNSDIRLKEYLKPLNGSLGKLYDLKGYHYQWKDKTRSQALQTGLIAQEVETVFPELVETDKEGYKSVNYIGLIPHLLEAVKELKQENSRLSDENAKLTSKANEFGDLEKRLEAIEASLAKDPSISVK